MTLRSWTLAGVLTIAFTACSSQQPETTATMVPSASARLTGTVRSSSGQPLDSAWVSLQLSGDYGSAFAYTNASGQFAVNANRMFSFDGQPNNPDTLRVGVVVQWLKGKRPDGSYPELRSQQLLTFAPEWPTPSVVTLTVPVP